MSDFLDRLAEDARRRPFPPRTREADAPRSLARAILRRRESGHRLAVIAEIKRRSPSAGALAPEADLARRAITYEAAGAAAISVLTEPRHWGGSLEDLDRVRSTVSIPVLCKDVITTEAHVAAAHGHGADAILLIAEALDDALLARLMRKAASLGLEVLVEAHDVAAFGRAVRSGARLVGANARDLRHPETIDRGRARLLHSFVAPGQLFVAESGISSADDLPELPARVDAILVGTALMRLEDPAPLVFALAHWKGAPVSSR
ncbi:MAG TPA: indole-3-glycerol phosphate synthase TrpC [Candidatus Limnocylindria bacterium]|nr:indole-3-glycerol phosphate synthase TrpC [Candidatus Limnocylindria bacterium]